MLAVGRRWRRLRNSKEVGEQERASAWQRDDACRGSHSLSGALTLVLTEVLMLVLTFVLFTVPTSSVLSPPAVISFKTVKWGSMVSGSGCTHAQEFIVCGYFPEGSIGGCGGSGRQEATYVAFSFSPSFPLSLCFSTRFIWPSTAAR